MNNEIQQYVDLLIQDHQQSVKNNRPREFTISHVPMSIRRQVAQQLFEQAGGNKQDAKLKDFAQTVATAIPVAAGSIMAAPSVIKAATSLGKLALPFAKDFLLSLLGGEAVNEGIKTYTPYKSFGDFVYNASGASAANGTVLEQPLRMIADMTNPGYAINPISKSVPTLVKNGKVVLEELPTQLRLFGDEVTNMWRKVQDHTSAWTHELPYLIKNETSIDNAMKQIAKEGTLIGSQRGRTMYQIGDGLYSIGEDGIRFRALGESQVTMGPIDSHTYNITLTPAPGQTKIHYKQRKALKEAVDRLPKGTFIGGDYTSLPYSQYLYNLWEDGEYLELAKNLVWPSKPVIRNVKGLSTDSYPLVASFTKRYNPSYLQVPTLGFNSLGTKERNVYNVALKEARDNSTTAEQFNFLKQILNPWFKKQMPHIRKPLIISMPDGRTMPAIPSIVALKELGGKIKMTR